MNSPRLLSWCIMSTSQPVPGTHTANDGQYTTGDVWESHAHGSQPGSPRTNLQIFRNPSGAHSFHQTRGKGEVFTGGSVMLDAMLEAWRTHEAINRYLLMQIPEAGFAAIPLLKNGLPGKGRDVARRIAHMVDVRVAHFRAAEKALMKGVPNFGKGASASRRHLEAALEASSRGVEALFTCLTERGELVRNRGPLVLLCYLISHESHHRGSMELALKQNGLALSEALRWGIWGKWFSG